MQNWTDLKSSFNPANHDLIQSKYFPAIAQRLEAYQAALEHYLAAPFVSPGAKKSKTLPLDTPYINLVSADKTDLDEPKPLVLLIPPPLKGYEIFDLNAKFSMLGYLRTKKCNPVCIDWPDLTPSELADYDFNAERDIERAYMHHILHHKIKPMMQTLLNHNDKIHLISLGSGLKIAAKIAEYWPEHIQTLSITYPYERDNASLWSQLDIFTKMIPDAAEGLKYFKAQPHHAPLPGWTEHVMNTLKTPLAHIQRVIDIKNAQHNESEYKARIAYENWQYDLKKHPAIAYRIWHNIGQSQAQREESVEGLYHYLSQINVPTQVFVTDHDLIETPQHTKVYKTELSRDAFFASAIGKEKFWHYLAHFVTNKH